MNHLARVLVAYATGPMAAFDRAVCEGHQAARPVIYYWPQKILRAVGLVPPRVHVTVDPFVDIGVPFNNFTLMYPFWSEVGPVGGVLAWAGLVIFLHLFIRFTLARRASVAWAVAATAPVSIAVRAPWANAFFDGTLVIWVAVPLFGLLLMVMTPRWREPRTVKHADV